MSFKLKIFIYFSTLFVLANAFPPCSLTVSTKEANVRLGSSVNFTATYHVCPNVSEPLDAWVTIKDNTKAISVEPAKEVFTNLSTKASFKIDSKEVGHSLIVLNGTFPIRNSSKETNSSVAKIDLSDAFLRVNVYHYDSLVWISYVVGWLYFLAWSVSFYPQALSNFQRKSVVGLNFDFLGLNLSGFLAYSIYNVCFYFAPTVQAEYKDINPTGVIPVELNDVVFALHALFATIIQIIQCFIYDRGGQTMSKIAIAFLAVGWSGALIFLVVILAGDVLSHPWLTFLYYFSNFKLVITIIKYIPQAYFNYQRKSTVGWSIGNILLDFTGGLLSIVQMFIIAFNFNDWFSIFGNFVKFGLGLVSILFDCLFMLQHYILYPRRGDYEARLLDGKSTESLPS